MKKLTLITLLSAITVVPAFAAPGDTSIGSAVFSGFVPGFVSNGDIIVTGAGGSEDATSFVGTLQVNSDGTFATTKPVVLEAHDYTDALLGALTPANWTVSQVNVLPASMGEVQPNIVVGDNLTGTELTSADYLASTLLSPGDTIQLYVANDTAHSTPDDIAGTEVIVNVDMIATLP
ncbi:hypothetical protein [Vibrio crassostreae]|uniref:hypothetical protein n=1 Tax=Vibrio crassostreae TaxID=246167 RepID=UPI0002EFBC44|nr:hypothetical protein [Vibrio crassostreae]OEF01462.1 hypothetical protein A136_02135 [Vibrio crassostreae 9ZC13]OEF08766.1 hypothetical protein A138_08570 [Vibrio crassostreae 9ZC77]